KTLIQGEDESQQSGEAAKRRLRKCDCFFFQAEDGIRDWSVTGVQTCALPISLQPLLSAGLRPGSPGGGPQPDPFQLPRVAAPPTLDRRDLWKRQRRSRPHRRRGP